MAPEDFRALDAQIDALDSESACRVARLVVECGASIPLAMQAVADANTRRASGAARPRPAAPHHRLIQSCLGAVGRR
jgi:hypothetical protein